MNADRPNHRRHAMTWALPVVAVLLLAVSLIVISAGHNTRRPPVPRAAPTATPSASATYQRQHSSTDQGLTTHQDDVVFNSFLRNKQCGTVNAKADVPTSTSGPINVLIELVVAPGAVNCQFGVRAVEHGNRLSSSLGTSHWVPSEYPGYVDAEELIIRANIGGEYDVVLYDRVIVQFHVVPKPIQGQTA